MKLIYAANAEKAPKGALYRNPRYFTGPEPKVEAVYLDDDYPAITEAYLALGVDVIRLDTVAPVYQPAPGVDAPEAVSIPADWRSLPWSQPDERGLTLRGLASAVSVTPIRSKDDATAAIYTYLAGDLDRPLPEAEGLTRRELNASLEGLHLSINPDEAPEATFARYGNALAAKVAASLAALDDD